MVSFSAREAADRSQVDPQLWASEEQETSYFVGQQMSPLSMTSNNNNMQIEIYFEETAASKKSIEVYNDIHSFILLFFYC